MSQVVSAFGEIAALGLNPEHFRVAKIATIVCLCALIGGCHNWHRDPTVLVRPLGDRARVQLWSRGEVHEVHGVRVRGDSVIAVPYWLPPDCDTCAVRLARSQIDSVRIQQPATTRTFILGGVVVAVSVAMAWIVAELASLGD
jgi:hypothetical protein